MILENQRTYVDAQMNDHINPNHVYQPVFTYTNSFQAKQKGKQITIDCAYI